MSQRTEIRHMHDVDGVPRREIARRLGLDVKTVRRALARTTAPTERASPPRGRLRGALGREDRGDNLIGEAHDAWAMRPEPRATESRASP